MMWQLQIVVGGINIELSAEPRLYDISYRKLFAIQLLPPPATKDPPVVRSNHPYNAMSTPNPKAFPLADANLTNQVYSLYLWIYLRLRIAL